MPCNVRSVLMRAGTVDTIVLILLLLILEPACSPDSPGGPGEALAGTAGKTVFLVSGNERRALKATLDEIGILARSGVQRSAIDSMAVALGLKARWIGNDIYVLELPAARTPSGVTGFIGDFQRNNDRLVERTGIPVMPEGGSVPMILTDDIIIQFRTGVPETEIDEFVTRHRFRILERSPLVPARFLLRVPGGVNLGILKLTARYQRDHRIQFAQPNFIVVHERRQPQAQPADPYFNKQWDRNNLGAGGATMDADVDWLEAWALTRGNPKVVIAVFDDGFDICHPDLAGNLLTSPGEIPCNGIDDNGDGHVDAIVGWDFRGGDSDPSAEPTERHGTPVAGIAAAKGNNIGVIGACPDCRLMLVRLGTTVLDDVKAFDYARVNGADIISNSWGYAVSTPDFPVVEYAIADAAAAIPGTQSPGRGGLGCVVLFSMNEYSDDDCLEPTKDISSLQTVIGVSGSTDQDKLWGGGPGDCMDLLAPTERGSGYGNIVTTDLRGPAGQNSGNLKSCPECTDLDYTCCFGGTSASTPLAAGVAGLIMAVDPGLTRIEIQMLLQDTTDKIEPLIAGYGTSDGYSNSPQSNGPVSTHGYGRINAYEAIRVAATAASGGLGGKDIFMRDNRLDWGNTVNPSNTLFESPRGFIPHWESVDIKVDGPSGGYQNAPSNPADFELLLDEDPVAASLNKIYIRVRNRGPYAANQVMVKLHWAFAGTALPPLPPDFWNRFPADSTDPLTKWHSLGMKTLATVAYSGSSAADSPADAAQILEFEFQAPLVNLINPLPRHYCLLAIINATDDPVSTSSSSSFIVDDITPKDNNVTQRNLVLQDAMPPPNASMAPAESFYVRNPYDQPVEAILSARHPRGWKILLEGAGLDRPFGLAAGEERIVVMNILTPEPRSTGEVIITQQQVTESGEKKMMGGLSFRFTPSSRRARRAR